VTTAITIRVAHINLNAIDLPAQAQSLILPAMDGAPVGLGVDATCDGVYL